MEGFPERSLNGKVSCYSPVLQFQTRVAKISNSTSAKAPRVVGYNPITPPRGGSVSELRSDRED
jgi:hypothetical protein